MFDKWKEKAKELAKNQESVISSVKENVDKIKSSPHMRTASEKLNELKTKVDQQLKQEKSQINNINQRQTSAQDRDNAEKWAQMRDEYVSKPVEKAAKEVVKHTESAWTTVKDKLSGAKPAAYEAASKAQEGAKKKAQEGFSATAKVFMKNRSFLRRGMFWMIGGLAGGLFLYGIATSIPNAIARYQLEKLRLQMQQEQQRSQIPPQQYPQTSYPTLQNAQPSTPRRDA